MYPKFLASSQDPTQLSVTVSSAIQGVLYLVAFAAVHKGLDPTVAQTQVQALIDLTVNALPAVLATYHFVNMFWGAVRKLLSYWRGEVAQS